MIPQTLKAQIKQSYSNFVIIVGDPCISRIEKNVAQNCSKFLDLYASIYGICFREHVMNCYSTHKRRGSKEEALSQNKRKLKCYSCINPIKLKTCKF